MIYSKNMSKNSKIFENFRFQTAWKFRVVESGNLKISDKIIQKTRKN